MDVEVKLYEPDGKMIASTDWGGKGYAESLWVLPESAGEYKLEVSPIDKQAEAGRYGLRIEKIGKWEEATTRDRDFVTAHRTFREAGKLRDQGTADSLRQAIEKYKEATPLWRSVEDRNGEANAINETGFVYALLGESQKALEYYRQALSLWRGVKNHREEAIALQNIGMAHVRLGKPREALEFFDQALILGRSVGDRFGEATTLNSIGTAYGMVGERHKELEYFSQALQLRRVLKDRPGEARTLNNIGVTYLSLGEKQRALEYFHKALPLRRVMGDRRGEANTLHNIGRIYQDLSDLQNALNYLEQALRLERELGDLQGEPITLNNIGAIYRDLGKLQKAQEYHNQALNINRAVKDPYNEAYTLSNIGVVYLKLGDSQRALDFFTKALALQRTVGDTYGEAYTLANLGNTYSSLHEQEKALTYLRQALSLARAVGDRSNEAATLRVMARVDRNLGRLDTARAQIEIALDIVESARGSVASQNLRTSYLASKQDYYEFYIDLLMQMHKVQPVADRDADALQASERARARSLVEILNEAHTDIRKGVDPLLLERERSTQQQLNVKSERLTRLLSGKHSEEQETAARKEVEGVLSDYRDVEAQIRAKSPRYAALTQPQPLSLKEIQQLLDKETLLLEYALGKERSYLWAVTPNSVTSFELPGRAEIEATARRFYELVTTRKNRELEAQAEAAAALSRLLLRPVADQLGRKRLLIVTDGALHYIPFAALPEPIVNDQRSALSRKTISKYQPLLINHEIVSLPSASVLAVLRRELAGRLPSPKTVAVLADPVFRSDDSRLKPDVSKIEKTPKESSARSSSTGDFKSEVERSAWESGVEDLPRLQHSREEASAIVSQIPASQVLLALDFAANREAAISGQLEQYRIVHFATHSLLNNVHPELSGIVLSLVDKAGRSQNGFLRLHEVYNLKLPAELVVLSGCRTAWGKEVKGEGLIGLTRGFMYAGAPRVVVSLWTVSDQGTAELMKRFYQGMLAKGLRPAAALRAAQIAMWKSKWWEAPYYWAGFVLEGEWR